MNYNHLKELWKNEEKAGFKGWDFSYLNKRWENEELPWSYEKIIKEHLNPENKLLDMGTGGGEFLLSLNHPYHKTTVTEMWEPNVIECNKKLSPLGINVQQVHCDHELPFEDDSFDIIINRHESYDPAEVKRILKPNGLFITQQVGNKNNEVLSKFLINNFKSSFSENNLINRINELKENNFKIIYEAEYFPYVRFFDVGALVYFAKIIEWEFPNFTVNNTFDKLCKLHEQLEQKSFIESFEHRFIILSENNK